MPTDRKDKPEVKTSKAGSLFVELGDVIQSKSGRQTIRNMTKLSKRARKRRSENQNRRPQDG